MFCRNHPERPARRHCYFCRSPVCPSCQLRVHHHVFCGSHCVTAFEEREKPKSRDLSDQLEDFDRNVEEGLAEQGEAVSENVRAEFRRLEDELDRALTTLATMVEGGASAASREVAEAATTIRKELEELRRDAVSSRSAASDERKTLHQLLLTARSSLVDLRGYLEEVHRKESEGEVRASEAREALVEELGELGERLTEESSGTRGEIVKHREALDGLLEKLGERLAEESSNTRREISKQREELDDFVRKELPEHFEESGESQEKRIAVLQKELEKRFDETVSDLSGRIDQQISSRLQRLIDDIASLTVAQRGNWNEVVKSATKGAKEAGEGLRSELRKQLTEEVSTLAKEQLRALSDVSDGVARELKTRIRIKMSPWPHRMAYGALAAGVAAALAVPFFLLRQTARPSALDTAGLEQRWTERQEGLRSWLEERLTALEEAARRKVPEARAPAAGAIPTLTRGNTLRKEFALTFDAGSNAKAAMETLDILKAKGVQSTMFLTGEFLANYPDVVTRIVHDGHEVGNHLLRHDPLVEEGTGKTLVGREDLLEQLRAVEKRFETLTGREMARLWRAPYGLVNPEVLRWAAAAGYTHVGWTRNSKRNLDTRDWVMDPNHPAYLTADQIVAKIDRFERTDSAGLNGAIVLMHLGSEREEDYPHKKLPGLIDELGRRGYREVTVSEVIRADVARR